MRNTVILTGKGLHVGVFLRNLHRQIGGMYTDQLKWYHRHTRHELRLQNLDAQEIKSIESGIKSDKLNVVVNIF